MLFTRPSSLSSRCCSAAVQTGGLIDRQAARPGSRVAAPVMLRSLSRSEVVLFCFVFFTAEGKSVISETCNRCATDGACLFVPFPLKSQTSERVAVPPRPLSSPRHHLGSQSSQALAGLCMQSRGEKNTVVSMWAGLEMLCMLTYLWSSAAFFFWCSCRCRK